MVEDTASVAAAGTSSPVVDLVPEKDITEASVFDLEILDCKEPLASLIYQVCSGACCFHHALGKLHMVMFLTLAMWGVPV